MFKTKLQELCHRKSCKLPDYSVVKQGQDHDPRFEAVVTVDGKQFHSPAPCKSSKQAQNEAAKLAFNFFSLPSSPSCPQPQLGMSHLYKNQLQNFAQKRSLTLPIYTCECDGPPHANRFRCKVEIDGKAFESQDFFATLKDAENAVAQVALMSLCQDGAQKDSCIYKNLLQEMAQKRGLGFPAYFTSQYGELHEPIFVSTVKIGEETFQGERSRTKKQAEMGAAKVAYITLNEGQVYPRAPLIIKTYQRRGKMENNQFDASGSSNEGTSDRA